jgi:hypothetical protein
MGGWVPPVGTACDAPAIAGAALRNGDVLAFNRGRT